MGLIVLLLASAWADAPPSDGPAAPAEPAVEVGAPEVGAPEVGAPEVGPLATRYTGWQVAQRSLVAADGTLPEGDLEGLLLVRQDDPYDPRAVRRDIALLHRILDARQVEVAVEEWPAFDAAGEPVPGVRVEYRVYSPPRVERVVVRGNRVVSARELAAVLGREKGDAWFPEDAPTLAEAVVEAYRAAGWPSAAVTLESRPGSRDGRVELALTVVEGVPDRVTEVVVTPGRALPAWRVRRAMARAGVREGRPLAPAALARAREAVLEQVREDGWYAARVTVAGEPDGDGTRVAVLVAPGRHYVIERAGGRLPSKRALVRYAGLESGVRLATLGEDASAAITEGLRDDGWLDAAVEVRPEVRRGQVRVAVTGDRGPRYRLRRLRFLGAEAEADRVWTARYLRGAFREASADVLERGRVTPDAIADGLVALEEFYRSQGYLGVDFEAATLERGAGRRVAPLDLTVRVTPGVRTTLERVTVEGAAAGVAADALFADLAFRPLNPAALDARSRALVEQHKELGYLQADARVTLEVDPGGATGRARVVVEPGPEVYVRGVVVQGYRRTRRSVIEREIDISPGDPVVPSRLAGVRRRLYDLGMFSRVAVDPVGDEDRVKDVLVVVEEKPNLHFEVGGGAATDLGVRTFLRGGHRNLWGYGHTLTFFGQAGIGWQGDAWNLDWADPEWRAALRYEAPHVPTRGERAAVDLLINEEQQEARFRLSRTGGGLGLLLRLGDRGSAEVAYRVQARRLLDVDPALLVVGDPWLDELGVDAADLTRPVTPSTVRAQSGLSMSFVLDRRDDPFNPTRGGVGSLGLEISDRLLSDVTFVRGEGAFTRYQPLGPLAGLLRLRGGVGYVPDRGWVLPVEDRFRLGGDGSFRGFSLDTVGPANARAPEAVAWPDELAPLMDWSAQGATDRWVATGGDAMAVGTLELQVPMPLLGVGGLPGVRLAVFGDVGNVWWVSPLVETDSMRLGQDPPLRGAVGVGVRTSTAIGPVAVDLAFNVDRLSEREETPLRLHLSLGAL